MKFFLVEVREWNAASLMIQKLDMPLVPLPPLSME